MPPVVPPPHGFCAGTRIVTMQGELPVERLVAGAAVLTLSGAGPPLKPVLRLARIPAGAAPPVRILAGALDPGVPVRDMCVGAGHGIAIEDMAGRQRLVPAGLLVNGASIRHEAGMAGLARFAIELAAPDLVMANGLAAECGHPRSTPPAVGDCAAHAMRSRLLERAVATGHLLTDDPGLGVWCRAGVADWRAAEVILRDGGDQVFLLPPGDGAVELRSRSFVPAEMHPEARDGRHLGVAVERVVHEGAELDLAGAACGEGFLAIEMEAGRSWRWTGGVAALSLPPRPASTVLELRLRTGWARYWKGPGERAPGP